MRIRDTGYRKGQMQIARLLRHPVSLATALVLVVTGAALAATPSYEEAVEVSAKRTAVLYAKHAARTDDGHALGTQGRAPARRNPSSAYEPGSRRGLPLTAHRAALRERRATHLKRGLAKRTAVRRSRGQSNPTHVPAPAPANGLTGPIASAPPASVGQAPGTPAPPSQGSRPDSEAGPEPPPTPSTGPPSSPEPDPPSEPSPPAPPPAPEPPPAPSPPPPAPEPPPEPSPPPAPEPPPPPAPEPPPEPSPPPAPEPPPPAPVPPPEPSPPPAPSPDVGLTIGIDGGYADWSGTETTYRAELGAAVTRHEWDPDRAVDAQDALVLKAASQVGTRIHALLGGNQLGDATHYRDWVVAFIRRYGVGGSFWKEHPGLDESRYAIRAFELGNEPYFGEMSANLYADTVRPTLEEVQRLGLPARIILPSRVYGTDTSWMDTLYQRIPNLNDLFYAFADHPYWYGHDPATVSPAGPFGRIDVLRERMDEKGASSKPILITEYGESTANCGGECGSESDQAEHLQKMLNAVITRTAWRVEMFSVFQLLDRGTGSSDRELQFGLLRQNGTPKPSYAIVRDLMQQYR